ncbi:DEFECTIVE IN MERISTEM SILENCING 7, RNA-DIRECTED DNA METHYLATION 1 [Hibiscus trionum]|uniref:DEFECTIVE IN MERISTEM SILENCING 7, RNA-DIRECTED DNA METHYLATION 1 n=1 Tax=Hibiscus trionum TaxID=183268 RepID=A0A9W7I213_HIBTR|nr:DEFECTIVE IN MERISTEM SILENCING 7, RNA-DIRECTED DNA METHYLATION 1 [Hibiscus trionum]
MKKFLIPKPVPISVSPEPSLVTWQRLGESMRQKYEQPLHYLTQILLKQWDESRGNNEVMLRQPIGNVIDPSKAEASVWVIEQFNRQFASHHYIAKLWISDPKYRYFVDDLQNYSPS